MGARNHGQWVGLRNARSDLRVMDHGIRTLNVHFSLRALETVPQSLTLRSG